MIDAEAVCNRLFMASSLAAVWQEEQDSDLEAIASCARSSSLKGVTPKPIE